MVKIYFSDFFEVSEEVMESYGVFNVSLLSDLPLFVDPFLLFNSSKPEYQRLHDAIIGYLKFLRDKSADQELDAGLIRAWYMFPEVKQNWLGFSSSGNSGRGLGGRFAGALHINLAKLLSNFGNEKVTRSSHLEKLCLIQPGVGRDSISDFTNNLIKEYLLEYTQTFTQKHVRPEFRGLFTSPKVRFNYETESWQSGKFDLPRLGNDYVLLTPVDILTKDETWINRNDLIDNFSTIPDALPNNALRAQVNNYFKKMLPKRNVTRKDERSAAAATLLHFPDLIDRYIRFKEDNGDKAKAVSSSRVRSSKELYVQQFRMLPLALQEKTGFYSVPGSTYDEAMLRVQFLKDAIENKGAHRVFYIKGQPLEREEDLQILYRMTWFAAPVDVTREANDGRGPVDFKVSNGAADKTLVEFKLAKNSHLEKNLKHQAEIYQKASDANRTIKVILFFTAAERLKVERIFKNLGITKDPDIVTIDARKDNKPSGSKAG